MQPVTSTLGFLLLSACSPKSSDSAIDRALDVAFPAPHPHLAESPWPISHASTHSQGSSPFPGPLSEDVRVNFIEVGLASVTLIPSPADTDGSIIAWGSTPTEVYRLRLDDSLQIVDRIPSGSGLSDLVGGAYTLLDADGVFTTVAGTTVRSFIETNSAIALAAQWELPAPQPEESLRGLSLTYDGVRIVVSSLGRVVALSAELTLLSEVQLPGEVSNSIAVDEDGGVYVVTSEALFRVQWNGAQLSLDPQDGAWEASYETGGAEINPGRLGIGSGSTPSLMTVGEDKLVVITDAQPLMHIVAFWRDKIPHDWIAVDGSDPRMAGLQPVRFGNPDAQSSVSEQSVLVMGNGAAVVNNDYGGLTGMEPVIAGVAPPGIERFGWDEEAKTLSSTWAIRDISCPNGIPTASSATGLMYCIGKRDSTWTLEAIDWLTGEPSFQVMLGSENQRYNSNYAATEIGPNGSILTGTLTGALWIHPEG